MWVFGLVMSAAVLSAAVAEATDRLVIRIDGVTVFDQSVGELVPGESIVSPSFLIPFNDLPPLPSMTAILVEPGVPLPCSLGSCLGSDEVILRVTRDFATSQDFLNVSMSSADFPAAICSGASFQKCLVEIGTLQDVTAAAVFPLTPGPGGRVHVLALSDTVETTAVPEPGTLLLLGGGLAGLATWRRRRGA
jgi:hypothetical protein